MYFYPYELHQFDQQRCKIDRVKNDGDQSNQFCGSKTAWLIGKTRMLRFGCDVVSVISLGNRTRRRVAPSCQNSIYVHLRKPISKLENTGWDESRHCSRKHLRQRSHECNNTIQGTHPFFVQISPPFEELNREML